MKNLAQTLLTLAIIQSGLAAAQSTSSDSPEPAAPTKPTRAELKDKQLDVSLEARDIERVLGKLKRASDLAKERITEAAKTAESASTSLEKGDSKAARAEAQLTNDKFKEIIQQLEALLKEETPQRIAEARQLAQKLAKAERQFAETFQGALNPPQTTSGQGKVDPKSQVKPMSNANMKTPGGQAQSGGGGKNGDDKPMPDGQGGKSEDKDKGKAGKAGSGAKPDKKDGEKKTDGGAGKDPMADKQGGGAGKDKDEPKTGDEPKPDGGGAGGKKKEQPKPGENQDVPAETSRTTSGATATERVVRR